MIKKTIAKTREFFGEVKVEAKKVSYPTRDETMGTTAVVLVLVVVVAIYLWFVDLGLAKIMRMVLP
jgi:preprotein translocase subunit SecE